MLRSKQNKKQTDKPFELADHKDHLISVIAKMKKCKISTSNKDDQISADEQFAFAEAILKKIEEMLTLNNFQLSRKKELGKEMTDLTKEYFGEDRMPAIVGAKSMFFASLLAEHFDDFTKVTFNEYEKKLSSFFAPMLDILSIPEQIQFSHQLAENIRAKIADFERKGSRTKSGLTN